MGEIESNSARSPVLGRVGFWLGPAAFLLVFAFVDLDPGNPLDERMAAVAALMAVWWISDAIPLAATALLPLVFFPLAGILGGGEVAPLYVNYVIFLFLGGFLIALAMERWNLHRRIALRIIGLIGSAPPRLVLGFMVATAFLSMWISNTATAIMMLAIGLAVIRQAEDTFGREKTANLSVALLLGIAYGASIGGFATLVGTPPNLALVRLFDLSFPEAAAAGDAISFGRWMIVGVPISLTLLASTWFILVRLCFRSPGDLRLSAEIIAEERRRLGPMKFEEKVVLAVFAATATLWTFREDLPLGIFTLPGWSSLLPYGDRIDDGTIAIASALILFLIPTRVVNSAQVEHATILDGSVFARVPWHIILLFGGGFALAKGFQTSGLSDWIGAGFVGLGDASVPVLVAAICTILTFLTELTSNAATTEMILPILASISKAAGIHPLLLMVPATISASCAFMLPVATPPNAIVFGSGRIRIRDMVVAGLLVNLSGIVLVTGLFLLLGPVAFGIDPGSLPDWVK